MAAAKGQATLRGRFPAGATVELVKVDGPHVLRTSPSDKVVGSKTVSDEGEVQFSSGVDVGDRYFIRGYVDGVLREVRITGTAAGEESAVLSQPPVGNDEVKLGSGKTLAEHAAEREDAPDREVQPAAKQSHARDVVQRSATPLGYATPVDPEEVPPYGKQEDHDGNIARSDTATGQAALIPVDHPPESQEDADDGKLLQRSDTPRGVTTPIPTGDAVQATLDRDAADSKDMGGTEPDKAAARPPVASSAPRRAAKKSSGGSKKSAKKGGSKAAKKTARKRSR